VDVFRFFKKIEFGHSNSFSIDAFGCVRCGTELEFGQLEPILRLRGANDGKYSAKRADEPSLRRDWRSVLP